MALSFVITETVVTTVEDSESVRLHHGTKEELVFGIVEHGINQE